MTALLSLIDKGGPAMIAIMILSVVLYSRCFKLWLTLRLARRAARLSEKRPTPHALPVHLLEDELHESFRQERIMLGSMIAAAPLLGLLGTVSGMVKTFESLSAQGGGKSMEGLASGISEVLVATESGLLVALPALLLVYLAHREMRLLVGQFTARAADFGRKAP